MGVEEPSSLKGASLWAECQLTTLTSTASRRRTEPRLSGRVPRNTPSGGRSMVNSTVRLSVRQVSEALSDDNKFYASRHYNKSWADLTVEELLTYYIANAPIGMTVIGFDVHAEDEQPLFV